MPTLYKILIKGHLDLRWSESFDGMTITHLEIGETLLSGPVVDQTALHGLLNRIRDMNLILIGLTQLAEDGVVWAGNVRPNISKFP